MDFIPNMIEPYEDELLLSFIARLGKANGLNSLETFFKEFSMPATVSHINFFMHQPELFNRFFKFYKPLDPRNFFLKHSIFSAMFPFLDESTVLSIVDRTFQNRGNLSYLLPDIPDLSQELKLCPKCMAEDFQVLGEFYYHVPHHLPGVICCHKHGCLLQTSPHQHENILKLKNPLNSIDMNVSDDEKNYALFFKNIYDLAPDFCLEDTQYSIQEPLAIYTGSKYLISRVHKTAKAMFEIFKDAKLFIESLHRSENTKIMISRFLDFVDENYRIIPPFRATMVLLENKITRELHISTPYGFWLEWKEASLDSGKNPEVKQSELFNTFSDQEWILLKGANGKDNRIQAVHFPSGKIYKGPVSRLLYESVEQYLFPTKNRMLTFNRIRACDPSFELIENNDRSCLIKHRDCGKIFRADFYSFLINPRCPYCNPLDYSKEGFKQTVLNLCGDSFKVLDVYENRTALIREKNSGDERIYRIDYFAAGFRYPDTSAILTKEQAEQEVARLSDDEWKISEWGVDLLDVKIVHTKTKIYRRLPIFLIFQELSRPTPSSLIPVNRRLFDLEMDSSEKTVLGFIRENFDDNELFLRSDLKKVGQLDKVVVDRCLRLLEGRKLIYRYFLDSFCQTNREVSKEEYVRNKYIEHKGSIFGFYSNYTIASQYGFSKTKPACLWVVSNAYDFARPIGRWVSVRPSIHTITSENWKIMQAADLFEIQAETHQWNYRLFYTGIKKLLGDYEIKSNDLKKVLESSRKAVQDFFDQFEFFLKQEDL